MNLNFKAGSWLLPVLLLTLVACESPTSVKVNNGPTFLLDGSGRLASFQIYGPKQGNKIATPFDTPSIMWQVQATNGYFRGAPVAGLRVAYGEVPKGYTQTFPISASPPSFRSGNIYYLFAESTDAPVAGGFFYMDGNVPVMTNVPGLCQSGFSGDIKPLNCATNAPFVEPSDLKKLVQNNRVEEIANR